MSSIGWPLKSLPRMNDVRSSRTGSARRCAANWMAYIAISIEPLLASPDA